MKLAVYRRDGRSFLGALTSSGLIDVTPWGLEASGASSDVIDPLHWCDYISLVMQELPSLQAYVASCQHICIDLETVELLPPLLRPGKIVAIGTNYLDHAVEVGRASKAADAVQEISAVPRLLGIFPSSIAAPCSTLNMPSSVKKLDFEAELAVVIGKSGKDIEEQAALSHVFGYMTANDFSAREYQFDIQPPQTTRAKSMDGFTPLGPWITTADEISDPQQLSVRCWVNDQRVQDGHTGHMQFGVASLIARISTQFSLHPGDLILTGTPAGCGAFQKPPRYLRSGDVVRTEVEQLGELITTIA
jgi:2-keto-4-pentenoate hydratase/2-oxohepta-3-ene-1,7-dioic acid hydratase in catechol pathway